jgi:hypothetical protein
VESFGLKLEALPLPLSSAYIVIRYFGSRGRIFNVRFRNLKGGFLSFQETSPDNGDVDFIRAVRTYKEVGYDGLLIPTTYRRSPEMLEVGRRLLRLYSGGDPDGEPGRVRVSFPAQSRRPNVRFASMKVRSTALIRV